LQAVAVVAVLRQKVAAVAPVVEMAETITPTLDYMVQEIQV
jgi:hypothetical protein